MSTLPDRPDLDHLKKQAKALLRQHRSGEPEAVARLPAAPRLHDAQLRIARDHGFASWTALKTHVAAAAFASGGRVDQTRRWLALVYGGDVTGTDNSPQPAVAAHLWRLGSLPADPAVACATGDADRLDGIDPNQPLGPFQLPPLVAVTHSRLGLVPDFLPRLRAAAAALLRAGADPNARIFNRYPPFSLAGPDENGPLSALYGAAGVIRDPVLAENLLEAGADPNDGESLYHSVERPEVTRLLLHHGARIPGTNALRRALDLREADSLELLLRHGADPNEPPPAGPTQRWGSPLLRAIAIRASTRHLEALLAAGADPHARTGDGTSAYRLALQVGRPDIAERLEAAGAAEPLSLADEFVAACARGDAAEARHLRQEQPNLPASLSPEVLRLLPDSAAWGATDAVRTMVELGWPVAARGGDWDATALNHAVMRGDPHLTAFLLAHGASWHERHGYGSDVLGTLSWASVNEPTHTVEDPDWAACARALVQAGLPGAAPDPAHPSHLVIDGRSMPFADDVAEALLERSG